MQTKLNLISEIAAKDGNARFNNLAHMLNVEWLKVCFKELKPNKAAGVDGESLQTYAENLQENLEDLVARMKRQAYKPQAVKRVYIPKANGKMRPLGIPAVEDKIVQKGIAKILEAIYEKDFQDFSYGFRPGRSCHMALNALDKIIMCNPINHIIDADIKGFFDNVDHEWMMRMLERRIQDKNLLRLIWRFLKAGVIEEGKQMATEKGTPQGGLISPILANIYLHYALDLWVAKRIKRRYEGIVEIVRYADDFVICLRYKREAEKLREELRKRLDKFGLELSEEKTRVIEFGRYARSNGQVKGRKPETFNFLGFTHFCGITQNGKFKVGRKTEKKRYARALKDLNVWLKKIRNMVKIKEWWTTLCAKLRGHFMYYGVSGNSNGIQKFYRQAVRLILKWMNRRSQKKSVTWERFNEYLKRHSLPKPRIVHNLYTLAARKENVSEEPYAGNPHVRFCEGR